MPVLAGSFATQSEAEDAILRLKDAGFVEGEFSLISHADDAVGAPTTPSQWGDRAVDAAAVGGVVGAIAGGALLGPIGAVIGGAAAGGGLAAALTSRGMREAEAQEYEARLHQGRYVVAVMVDELDKRAVKVQAILERAGAQRVDLTTKP